ncbi:MAG: hypothetical protein ACKOAU_03040, partial [Pirellula sp.]
MRSGIDPLGSQTVIRSIFLHGVLRLVAVSSLASSCLAQAPSPAAEVLAAQQRRIDAMQRASMATVGVFGTDSQGGGSGVCISPDGYVLTNFHVSSP